MPDQVRRAILERLRPAEQRHPTRGKAPEVDGVSAVGATDRDCDMFHAGFDSPGIPMAQCAQPPDEILDDHQ